MKSSKDSVMIVITSSIGINEKEIHEDFVQSSGPGGQNVNKVATAVKLRFDAANSPSLTPDVRRRLIRLAGRRMSENGVLVIDARRFRTQAQNRRDALNRLVALIQLAAERPRARKETRPTLASKKRRLEHKRRRAAIKRMRRIVPAKEE